MKLDPTILLWNSGVLVRRVSCRVTNEKVRGKNISMKLILILVDVYDQLVDQGNAKLFANRFSIDSFARDCSFSTK